MEIDGKPTLLEYEHMGGAVSTGEFGTRLHALFDPRSRADFRWKGWTTLRNRRAARFSYRIALEHSNYVIRHGTPHEGQRAIVVPYHGEVYLDEETHMTLRLTLQAEIPHGFPIDGIDSTVDYEFVSLGGKQYLLPSHAYVKSTRGMLVAENHVEFREYRKFQADATVRFDPPPEKK